MKGAGRFIGLKDIKGCFKCFKCARIVEGCRHSIMQSAGIFKARTDVSRVLGCKGAGLIEWYSDSDSDSDATLTLNLTLILILTLILTQILTLMNSDSDSHSDEF